MIELFRHTLETTPVLSLFLVIGGGYALGRAAIFGFSLGVGAVLFIGLAVGAFAPKAAPPGLVGTIGLLMFLYGIGIQYGPQFFDGLRGSGRRQNLVALVAVLGGLALAVLGGRWIGVPIDTAMGVFAGAMTSTATLQAALEAAGSRNPAIGYSVAYPLGVVAPMLCLHLANRVIKPSIPLPAPSVVVTEITIDAAHLVGQATMELAMLMPDDLEVMAVRKGHRNFLPTSDIAVAAGDAIMVAGTQAAVTKAQLSLGHPDPGRVAKDRRDLDGHEIFVSDASMIGIPLGTLHPTPAFPMRIAYVRRGDAAILPNRHTTLEFGDRVTVLAPPDHFPEVRRMFGDSITATAEFSYISLGLGMVLGILLGLIPIPLPGIGSFSLGLAGGPLVMALILGKLGRTGKVSWRLPLSANLVMRNFGLTIFLAAVGLASGMPFVTQIAADGLPLLLLGAAVVLMVVLLVMAFGHFLLRLRFDELIGIAAGATGNPAILVFANRLVRSDKPSVGYATIFPSMTIAKVLSVQIAIHLLG